MGYPESYNELAQWWDEQRLAHEGAAIIRAIEDRIGEESDERRRILHRFLYEEYVAQGRQDAANAIRGLDPIEQLVRWYREWRRDARGIDIVPALEGRIRTEPDAARLQQLRFMLASEYQERGDYAAAEAVQLADIAANPDEPMPLISLAGQKLSYEEKPATALPIIDRAVEVAMRTGIFRRHALATKARIALALNDHATVEDVLRRIMALTFTRGNIDIGTERDFFDRLPPGSIDPQVAQAYEEYCRARGRTETTTQFNIDRMVRRFAKPTWLKVARIIATVLAECERHAIAADADMIAGRIRLLVDQGKLEAQGNLSEWRFSEVRLPEARENNAGADQASSGVGAAAEPGSTIVIASRTLTIEAEGREIEVPVRIFSPIDEVDHWRCDYEIGWPDRPRRHAANGINAVQALLIATQMVGSELYTSEPHKAGTLRWDEPGGGYGFPLGPGVRDLYEGRDKLL